MSDIVITLPKTIKWSEYERELEAAKNGRILNFKLPFHPKKCNTGDRCYICHNGCVLGYHIITGIEEKTFTCLITKKKWSGIFVQRTGQFNKIEPIKMKGFQGFRYYKK